ncbi:MAG: DUF502 domain-containing protein [Geminicoccaceae bacterium]
MSDRPAPVGLTQRLRNYLLAGIIVSAPITITLFIVWQALGYVDRTVTPFIPAAYNPENYLPFGLPGIGLVVILGLLTLIGWLAAGLVGRTVMSTGERLLDRTPIVRGIYSTLKQLFETALSQSSKTFREVVLIEYPRRGIWSIAFVTGEPTGDIARCHDERLVSVFVPTTPIPAYGFLMYLPRAEAIALDMSVEDGMKLVISGGIVVPPERTPRPPLAPISRSPGREQAHGVMALEEVEQHS